jgi:hypothetical protein
LYIGNHEIQPAALHPFAIYGFRIPLEVCYYRISLFDFQGCIDFDLKAVSILFLSKVYFLKNRFGRVLLRQFLFCLLITLSTPPMSIAALSTAKSFIDLNEGAFAPAIHEQQVFSQARSRFFSDFDFGFVLANVSIVSPPKLPDVKERFNPSKFLSSVKSKMSVYGNYCGPATGNNFTIEPTDGLDAVCQQHDFCISALHRAQGIDFISLWYSTQI